jgi:hypothetical protein
MAQSGKRADLLVSARGGGCVGIVVLLRITKAGKPVFRGKPRVGYVFVLVTKRYLRNPK